MHSTAKQKQSQGTSGENSPLDFTGLKALYLNCTLKPSPEVSNTEGLMNVSRKIMSKVGVETELLRPVDYYIPPGIYPDMTEHGYDNDDWPDIQKKVLGADILIIGTPIWLGEKSSICTKVIERLYGYSAEVNNKGQYIYYGRTGGCIITGNEDGIKHCAMNILYSLQHLGYLLPPQADAGWVGEAGPGPSYLDENSGGPENSFTQRNTTFLTWNLLHMALMLAKNGGIPAHGNLKAEWE